MREFFLANEPAIRLAVFSTVLVAVALLEAVFPRRMRSISRWVRWPNNLGMAFVNTGLVRVVFPMAAVGVSLAVEDRGIGLIPWLNLPEVAAVVVAVLSLDFAVYLQHVMFHAVPLLWRLHRMHHADLDFDVTTGARFHPLEIMVSMIFKLAVITALGAPAVAVLNFEVMLNATSMFNHANWRLPARVDAVLRRFIVTPDMHRVHHSIVPHEANSNFGFNLPWWDFLFGTYRAQPLAGHEAMRIGIPQFRERRDLWLDRMLVQPLREGAGPYPIGRREDLSS